MGIIKNLIAISKICKLGINISAVVKYHIPCLLEEQLKK